MDRKSVLGETDQFQNRSHRNLLLYTDSGNMHCFGSKCLLLYHPFCNSNSNLSGKNNFWCYPRYCGDTWGNVLFLLGFSFLIYSYFILILPSFIPRIIRPVLPSFLRTVTIYSFPFVFILFSFRWVNPFFFFLRLFPSSLSSLTSL